MQLFFLQMNFLCVFTDWFMILFACVAAPYVKVYLMDNGKCVLKRRTRLARKTLDPLYQQQLQFEENPEGKVLQVKIREYKSYTQISPSNKQNQKYCKMCYF